MGGGLNEMLLGLDGWVVGGEEDGLNELLLLGFGGWVDEWVGEWAVPLPAWTMT